MDKFETDYKCPKCKKVPFTGYIIEHVHAASMYRVAEGIVSNECRNSECYPAGKTKIECDDCGHTCYPKHKPVLTSYEKV